MMATDAGEIQPLETNARRLCRPLVLGGLRRRDS